ncbi:hypothetical protein NUACC26_028220 [Scytonema sp. NUACC26]
MSYMAIADCFMLKTCATLIHLPLSLSKRRKQSAYRIIPQQREYGLVPANKHGMTIGLTLLAPRSVGSMRLRSP